MLEKLILILIFTILMLTLQTKVILRKGSIHLDEMFTINLHGFLVLLDNLHEMTIGGQGVGSIDGTEDELLDFISQDGHLVLEVLVRDSGQHLYQKVGLFVRDEIVTIFRRELVLELTLLLEVICWDKMHEFLYILWRIGRIVKKISQ